MCGHPSGNELSIRHEVGRESGKCGDNGPQGHSQHDSAELEKDRQLAEEEESGTPNSGCRASKRGAAYGPECIGSTVAPHILLRTHRRDVFTGVLVPVFMRDMQGVCHRVSDKHDQSDDFDSTDRPRHHAHDVESQASGQQKINNRLSSKYKQKQQFDKPYCHPTGCEDHGRDHP